jgi:F0F1-type ATP synthase assembly protein I
MTNLNDKKQPQNFAKYTGIAFQMLAIIGLFIFIGYQIDQSQARSKPIFTAILGLLGVVLSLYQVIRLLNKK